MREYIDGEILSQELAIGSAWSQTQAVDFLIDLMGILAFVHSFRYIHQDITPHNIVRSNADGSFNLIGFSSIKDLENSYQSLAINDDLNYASYIPYEQEQNLPQFNSDIYAVGVIAIQALTSQAQLERDPLTYELNWQDDVHIDPQLVKTIDRMVRPDYRNRYQSAIEVLADLQSFVMTQIPRRKSDRLKPYVIFGGAICTLLLGFGAARLLSASVNKLPLTPPAPKVTATLPPTINSAIPVNANIPQEGSGSANNWQSYVDKTAGIKIKYAPQWTKKDLQNIVTGEHVMFISPQQNSSDKYQENISVRVERLTNSQTTLSDYTRATFAEIKKYNRSAKIIESSSIILTNRPANLVVYTSKDENSLVIKSLEVWTIDRGKAYIFTYKAEPQQYYQFLTAAMMTINSFRLN